MDAAFKNDHNMFSPSFFKRIPVLAMVLLLSSTCFSQKQAIIGVSVTAENTSASDVVAGMGASFEKSFANHFAFETGFNYRHFIVRQDIYINYSLYAVRKISERYISIPILVKFKTAIINFSVGPDFDIYTGSKQSNSKKDFPSALDYEPNKKFCIGIIAKASKIINITDRIFLEPELRYNPVLTSRRLFYGLGLSAKYRLSTLKGL